MPVSRFVSPWYQRVLRSAAVARPRMIPRAVEPRKIPKKAPTPAIVQDSRGAGWPLGWAASSRVLLLYSSSGLQGWY